MRRMSITTGWLPVVLVNAGMAEPDFPGVSTDDVVSVEQRSGTLPRWGMSGSGW
jgi:hypothetical protein